MFVFFPPHKQHSDNILQDGIKMQYAIVGKKNMLDIVGKGLRKVKEKSPFPPYRRKPLKSMLYTRLLCSVSEHSHLAPIARNNRKQFR